MDVWRYGCKTVKELLLFMRLYCMLVMLAKTMLSCMQINTTCQLHLMYNGMKIMFLTKLSHMIWQSTGF